MTDHSASGSGEAAKDGRIRWLARVYSGDADALTDAAEEANLFERMEGYTIANFFETYRPLTKLIEARGPLMFRAADIRHEAPDLSFANLYVDDEVIFELRIRFERESPNRLQYWHSYPPLPDGVVVRTYRAEDAPGCVALERACPMELADGARWVIDRGDAFDDYLKLMESVDAAVAVADDRVVGFFSTALRPVRYHDADTFCAYQHHYRVHPDFRAGSISQALASHVDPRRTFETQAPEFPYAMVDPNNVHTQNMGFPPVENVTIARLAVSTNKASLAPEGVSTYQTLAPETLCRLLNDTHEERLLFKPYTPDLLEERFSRIPGYGPTSVYATEDAALGVWQVNERNELTRDGETREFHLAFILDYGFRSVDAFMNLLGSVCVDVRSAGATHLCLLCDTRAPEFEALAPESDDVQRFGLHTLPWLGGEFQAQTIYTDGVYT